VAWQESGPAWPSRHRLHSKERREGRLPALVAEASTDRVPAIVCLASSEKGKKRSGGSHPGEGNGGRSCAQQFLSWKLCWAGRNEGGRWKAGGIGSGRA
jgi:hypothetical protein